RALVAYHRWDAAQMRDDRVTAERELRACTAAEDGDFLRRLLEAVPSKILITSRLYPRDLEDFQTSVHLPGIRHRALEGLSPDDARALLTHTGITWRDTHMLDAFLGKFGRHPLLLKLIGGKVLKHLPAPGNFDAWYEQEGENIHVDDLDLKQR